MKILRHRRMCAGRSSGPLWLASAIALCGLNLNTSRAQDVSPTADNFGQQVAVASYIHPGADPEAWNRLIESPSNKVTVLVANVLNGPDSKVNPQWAAVIKRSNDAGKRILGYVQTGYLGQTGIRTRLGSTELSDWIAQIEQDVAKWYELYGDDIGGIFFDEGYNACGDGDLFPNVYKLLNQYTKTLHPGALTVANPGTVVPSCYADTADILMTFENDYATYTGASAESYTKLDWTPKSPSKIWHIVYNVPQSEVARVAETARMRGAGYIYITDDKLDNPYDTLPNKDYWSAHLSAVVGGVPSVAAAENGSGGPPPAPSGAAMLDASALDFTSVALTWMPSSEPTARHRVYVDGRHVVTLPPGMNRVTVGGLQPNGTYQVYVTAESATWGAESQPSNTVSASTLALPQGAAVTNVRAIVSATSAVYSADFLMPFSFRRLYVLRSGGFTDTDPCWTINQTITDYVCAVYMVENDRLFRYTGKERGAWSWSKIADVRPVVDRYKYTWTVPLDSATPAIRESVVVQAEGYGPLTNIFPSMLRGE